MEDDFYLVKGERGTHKVDTIIKRLEMLSNSKLSNILSPESLHGNKTIIE